MSMTHEYKQGVDIVHVVVHRPLVVCYYLVLDTKPTLKGGV